MAWSFAELHRRVVFGQSEGRIIWQPRIGCWYRDKKFYRQSFPPGFDGLTVPEIHRRLNCSARIYEYNACFRQVEDPRVKFTERKLNETEVETVVETPVGRQTQVMRKTPNSWATQRVKRPVASEAELKVARWRMEHAEWKWEQAAFDKVRAEWGELGAPTMCMPRVNVQHLFIDDMGVEQAVYALTDYPEAVEGFFQALSENQSRLLEVICASPIEIINFGDNVHCGTLPVSWFKKYVLPEYQRRCARLHGAGKFVSAHWDGDTKTLLPLAKETGLDGLEALTPEPQGDVTLAEIKAGLGDEMFLLDGIPAVYFDATFSVRQMEDCTRRLIDLFAPKLVLGISDEISSTGDLERIRVVGRLVDEYNARQTSP